MPQYTSIQLAAARGALRLRLQDSGWPSQYWLDSELNANIVEALRNWQALTGFYRDRATLTTAPNVGLYDLSLSGQLTAGFFDYNVTDVQLYQAICNHLLEPTILPYVGTDQFTQQQILNALQARRDQFLVDSGAVISHVDFLAGAPPISRVNLPAGIIDVRRAAWFSNFLFTTLFRIDENTASAFQNGWQTSQLLPNSYSVAASLPESIQIVPISNDGTNPRLHVFSVSTGPTLTLPSPGNGIALGVPDDFTYGVKFGALADLLRADGQDRDPARAAYCEQRYQESVQLARLNPSVLQGIFGTSILWAGSMFDEDAYNANWQNQVPGPPQRLAMVGRNFLATIPYANAAYSIPLDMIRNMIVPAVDTDFLQIGNEDYDAILDMAQHISSFKMGGQEFQQTDALYKNFIRLGMLRNNRLNASIFLRKLLDQPSQNYERQVPRLVPSPVPTDLASQPV